MVRQRPVLLVGEVSHGEAEAAAVPAPKADRDELDKQPEGVEVSYTLTRGQPPGWTGHTGRINQALLELAGWPAGAIPTIGYDRAQTVARDPFGMIEILFPERTVALLSGWRHVFGHFRSRAEKLLPHVFLEAVIVGQEAVQELGKAIVIDRDRRPRWLWVMRRDPDLVPASQQRRGGHDSVDLYLGVSVDT